MFTDLIIYPINNKTDHISEKYIFFFYRKKGKTKVNIFSILGRIWSRIRIKIKWIHNTDGNLPTALSMQILTTPAGWGIITLRLWSDEED